MTTMRDLNDAMSESEFDRLRDLRATTMIRLSADRIHQNYVAGTLDPSTVRDVESVLADLRQLGGDIAREKSATMISTSVGKLAGKDWEARRCPVGEGAHKMTGTNPFGITAYGYGSRGSYAFIGGANVKKVYEPPPIPPIK